jgi:hypothetical protein
VNSSSKKKTQRPEKRLTVEEQEEQRQREIEQRRRDALAALAPTLVPELEAKAKEGPLDWTQQRLLDDVRLAVAQKAARQANDGNQGTEVSAPRD